MKAVDFYAEARRQFIDDLRKVAILVLMVRVFISRSAALGRWPQTGPQAPRHVQPGYLPVTSGAKLLF
jgi:hypothetical protein